ncbi:cell wall hydrolase [Bartonella sp. Raccoon60]|uniref:cell wall hydrolase n=1 Tax=Bartonella sp. Raccoon60 TaxID=1933912 RepID=UPI000998EC5D|nr:cell wall hydrolase [Bartonella sp. Raccoon60]AQX26087.1 Cell Wall Hydrolase [Bartonella sp. Raccoon60]
MKKNQWFIIVLCVISFVIVGCSSNHVKLQKTDDYKNTKSVDYPLTERQCLMRAMYFESNRSSREGMIAVGTVVMNRVNSSAYPKTICGVVGQRKQFAPGVLTRPMLEKASVARVKEAADAVLRGERDKKSKNAMFFHTAGLSFPYKNMHYVRVAGGNAFYEKRSRNGSLQVPVNDRPYDVAFAFSQERSDNMSNFINSSVDSGEVKTEEIQEVPVSIEIAQADKKSFTPFVVAQLDKIPIPTSAPRYGDELRENTTIVAYAMPSQHQLNAVVAMLEERYRSR